MRDIKCSHAMGRFYSLILDILLQPLICLPEGTALVGWKVDLVTGFSFKEVPIKDAHMFDILSYQNIANLGNVFARRDVASFHASSRIEGSSEQYNVQLRIEREKES